MEAEGDAARGRHDLALYTAWHVEAFARVRKLPELRKLLAREPAPAALDAKIRAVLSTFPRA